METMAGMHRSCGCGRVTEKDCGKELTLAGWVNTRRDHGGLIFIDLRDRSGIVQVVMSPQYGEDAFHKAEDVRSEYVLAIRGIVRERSPETVNPKMQTGKIEVVVSEMRVLNKAKTPPFYVEDGIDVDETVRLKHRYIDLRRPEMQRNLIMRHKIVHEMRQFLDAHDFLERLKVRATIWYQAVLILVNFMHCLNHRSFLNSFSWYPDWKDIFR